MESDSEFDSDSRGFGVTLNHSNFYNTVLNHHFVVVKFYVSRLSRYHDLTSKYDEVAQILSSNNQVVFAKVNADDEKYLLAKYGILGAPAILIFKNRGNEIEKYQGPIDAKGINECLERLRLPHPPQLDVTQLQDKKNVIVGYFRKFYGREYRNFVKAAKRLKWEYGFYQCTDPIPDSPVVRLLNPLLPENKEKPFETRDFNVDAIVEFVKDRTTPDVIEYDLDPQELVVKFFCGEINNDKVMLFIDRNGLTPSAIAIETKYREFAMRNKKRGISFMIGSFEASQDAFQFFKLYKMAIAPLIVIQTTKGEIYWKEKLESANDIEAFMGQYKKDKSSIPRENIGPEKAKEVYVENFQSMVKESEKNVFLVLGMWCEHYKVLAQVLDVVATHFKDDDNVLIAKMYHTNPEIRSMGLNDDDPYATKDCPTLHFKRASRKKFMLYHGPTTSEEYIIQFIETNRDAVKPVKMESLEDVYKLIEGKKILIVAFFPKFSGKKYENFIEVTHKLNWGGYDFRMLDAKHHPDGGSDPVVRLFTSRKNKFRFAESKNLDVDALVKFINEESTPAIIEYGEHPQLFEHNFFHCSKYDKAMLFLNRSDDKASLIEKKYREVADTYGGPGINFMLGDLEASEKAYWYFNLKKSREPFIVFMNRYKDIYVKEHLMSGDDIEGLVKHFEVVRFESYMSSKLAKAVDEDLHECDDDTGLVEDSKDRGNLAKYMQTLRPPRGTLDFSAGGDTFNLFVMQSERNVLLVLFGTAWIHTRKLMSILYNAASHLEKESDTVITTVASYHVHDYNPAVRNALAGHSHHLKTYFDDDEPTIYYMMKNKDGGRDIVVYDGDLSGIDIIGFVNKWNESSVSQRSLDQQISHES